MKSIVVILLLATNGIDIQKVRLKYTDNNCNQVAESWVDVNMKYYSERNGDPKLQGWYDSKHQLWRQAIFSPQYLFKVFGPEIFSKALLKDPPG